MLVCFLTVYADKDVACEQRTEGGKCCVFPFIYQGLETHFCIRGGPSNFDWCATTENYDRDGEWGTCIGKTGNYTIFITLLTLCGFT